MSGLFSVSLHTSQEKETTTLANLCSCEEVAACDADSGPTRMANAFSNYSAE
jgi:hypothetical protein